MNYNYEVKKIQESIQKQEKEFEKSLILNPVENVPKPSILLPASSFLHGLYNSDKIRNNKEKKNSKIQFAGRNDISDDTQAIYKMWANVLGGEDATLRLLSGLHAHTVIFMCISQIDDTVMILPEVAGGHMSTKSILERLGLNVIEFCTDLKNTKIDKEKTIEKIKKENPKIIFFDRSEGLVYDDLSWLGEFTNIYKIFDASQYLTNIIAKDYENPFNMGFDAILSTLHKNHPGPQRALYVTKKKDEMWNNIHNNIGTYVSNMHVFSIYSAGLILDDLQELCNLSKSMLTNTIILENELENLGVPIVKRNLNENEMITHHIWIKLESDDEAFNMYLNLESFGILTNYRKLPYEIGYGLRLGLSGATQSGLTQSHIKKLANYISLAYQKKLHYNQIYEIENFILDIKNKRK